MLYSLPWTGTYQQLVYNNLDLAATRDRDLGGGRASSTNRYGGSWR